MDDTLLEREVATKPPPRWRNWWRTNDYGQTDDGLAEPGDLWESKQSYSSREEATAAAYTIILADVLDGFSAMEHLGAYPEGERP